MTSTSINDWKTLIPQRSAGYNWEDDTWVNAEYINMGWPFSAGALLSTVADLAKWEAALNTERLLPKPAWEMMWTPATLNDGSFRDYGFGWGIDEVQGYPKVSHAGGIPGFITYNARYPTLSLSVIVLTNSGSSKLGAIAEGVAGHFEPMLRPADV